MSCHGCPDCFKCPVFPNFYIENPEINIKQICIYTDSEEKFVRKCGNLTVQENRCCQKYNNL
mgnify:CR=1 FL=1